jgi:hypothetical protein
MPQTQLNDTTPELDPYVTCMTSPDAPGLILMAGVYRTRAREKGAYHSPLDSRVTFPASLVLLRL